MIMKLQKKMSEYGLMTMLFKQLIVASNNCPTASQMM